MKKYQEYIKEEVFNEFDPTDKDLVNVFNSIFKTARHEDIEKDYYTLLGREGRLSDYLKENNKIFTFGILKAIFDDSITHKRHREMRKGTYKFLTRAIPMVLAPIFIPISLISLVMGASRAFNKIITPVLKDPKMNYPSFLKQVIIKSMSLAEGDYRLFMPDDWFYNVFMLDRGMQKLIRKEHLINFAVHLSEIMAEEPDDKKVPKKYIQRELKKYIKNRFKVEIKINHISTL